MGPYLAKPETTIHSTCAENDRYVYCTAEMQGWRKTQEDAHTALLNYDDKGSAFFAVFDGHGGEEVSKYCALYLPDFIKNCDPEMFRSNIDQALKDSFLKFDSELKKPDIITILRELSSCDEPEEMDEDETVLLKKEAQMPLVEVIQNVLPDLISESSNDSETIKDFDKNKSNNDEVKSDEKRDDEKNDTPNGSSSKSETEATNGELSEKAESASASEPEPPPKIEAGPSTSGTSSTPAKPLSKAFKAEAFKAINQHIYEAFFSKDFDEQDDEEDEEDENEDFDEANSSENDDDDDDDDDDSEDEDDEDDDDDEDEDEIPLRDMNDSPFGGEYAQPGGGSGCTAIVAIVHDGTLHVANVGDSRCVLSRAGAAIEMSIDHKPEDAEERARIVKAGGEVTADGRVNGGLNLSRAIGDHLYKKSESLPAEEQMVTALPDVRRCELDLEKDQFLFLACDGIWNSMSSQEAVDFINTRMENGMKLKQICEELFKACLAPNTDGDGSGCDNMTCILVRFKRSTEPKRTLSDSDQEDSIRSVTKKAKTSDEAILYQAGPSSSKSR